MLRPASKSISSVLKKHFFAYCDDSNSAPTLIEQADAKLENEKPKIKVPQSFENLKNTFNSVSVGSYDGFRIAVQKQINLNAVTSHFYWIGSQLTGQQIYQYRLILPFDDGKLVNVATNIDLSSVEGEVKVPINSNINSKATFVLAEHSQLQGEVEINDDSSLVQFQIVKSAEPSLSISYMQSITPFLTLGGLGTFSQKSKAFSKSFGGIYNDGETVIAAHIDSSWKLMYLRKVNPNRVHLSTDLTLDESGNSMVSVAAEYTLKQSKLHMSVDSNLQLKSLVETSIMPGIQLQLSADVCQIKDAYRFGYGIMMG